MPDVVSSVLLLLLLGWAKLQEWTYRKLYTHKNSLNRPDANQKQNSSQYNDEFVWKICFCSSATHSMQMNCNKYGFLKSMKPHIWFLLLVVPNKTTGFSFAFTKCFGFNCHNCDACAMCFFLLLLQIHRSWLDDF